MVALVLDFVSELCKGDQHAFDLSMAQLPFFIHTYIHGYLHTL